MIESLFTLYCEDCEVSGQPSRLWVRAEIEVTSARGLETQVLVERIDEAITGLGRSWEVWFIDDGSTDGTFKVVEDLAAARPEAAQS